LQLTQLGAVPKLFTRDNCWNCAGLIETRCTIVVHLFSYLSLSQRFRLAKDGMEVQVS
jgi:hypothetical protein